MNTDAILDFMVEYYIWFIVGGAILLLAIIGFIADKKKLFKKSKNKNSNEEKQDNRNIIEESNQNLEEKTENELPIVEDYKEEKTEHNDTTVDNNVEVSNLNDNTEENNINEEQTNTYDDVVINDNQYDSDVVNDVNNEMPKDIIDNDVNEELDYIDNLEINSKSNDNSQREEPILNNDEKTLNNVKVEDYDLDKPIADNITIADDKANDNKTNDVEVIDIKDNSSLDEKTLDDKIVDLNDKDDEPLNISYSKLKKMVEEIIAEQEKESDDTDDSKLNSENISTSNSSISNNKEDIEPNIVPNLDPNTVESIKQLDEDEDDVWKF